MRKAEKQKRQHRTPNTTHTHLSQLAQIVHKLAQEPSDKVPEDDGVVCLHVVLRRGDARNVPEVAFPFACAVEGGPNIQQKDGGAALCEPAAIEIVDSPRLIYIMFNFRGEKSFV